MIKIEQIAIIPPAVIAAVFGVIACVQYRKQRAKLALWHRTFGDIVEVKKSNEPGITAPNIAVIRYQDSNGQNVTFESKMGGVQPGDRLRILVSRSNPKDVKVVSFMEQWGAPLIFGIISAGTLIGAMFIYLVIKP